MESVRFSSGRHRGRAFEQTQDVVEGIALRRNFARRPDQIQNLVETQTLSGVGARFVIDLFANHRSLEIVDAERKRRLREKRRDHDPVGLDVFEVVEKEPSDGEVAEVVESGRRGALTAKLDTELVVIRVIGERNVSKESVRLVL